MKLYEKFADKGYHTSIATTFGIDFDAYENVVLSRLRGAGCRNNMVFTDSRMLSHALGGASDLPQQAGIRYTVSGVNTEGVYHPKLFLQAGRQGGRIIIGSANLTPSGLAGNLELFGVISCGVDASGEQELFLQAWNYISKFIDDSHRPVAEQRSWMLRRVPWLSSVTSAIGPVQLTDRTLAALLTPDPVSGIGTRFANLVDGPVRRLIIISPYWDTELAALANLVERLHPRETSVLIDPETRDFPKISAGRIDGLKLFSRENFYKGRFIHAKGIIAQTDTADHMLMGSANCTLAALGNNRFAGKNEEICLYRRFPPDSLLNVLQLGEVFADDRIIKLDDLKDPEDADDLPLADLGKINPGQFELRGDLLLWYVGTIRFADDCTVTLLNAHATEMACKFIKLDSIADGVVRFQIAEAEQRPSFARVKFADGRASSPAIITVIGELKKEIREKKNTRIQNRLDDLEFERNVSLALLGLLDDLLDVERAEASQIDTLSINKGRKEDTSVSEKPLHKVLNYDDFVAGRRPRLKGRGTTYNSLAGSEVTLVRSILNRIIGLGDDDIAQNDAKGNGANNVVFNLGDETSDGAGDLEGGGEFGALNQSSVEGRTGLSPDSELEDEERRLRLAKYERDTKEQILRAVAVFNTQMRNMRKEGAALTNYDLVRLRVLLMVVASAASSERNGSENVNEADAGIRVLDLEDSEDSWPIVVGRLLFTFFGGNNPAIRQLLLTEEHDQIPDDLYECWGTCYWSLAACFQLTLSKHERVRIENLIKPLVRNCFLLTLPSKDELLSDDIMGIIDRMSESYASGLGVDRLAISEGYKKLVEDVFSSSG